MSRKKINFKDATELYYSTKESFRKATVWMDYLTSASRNYGLQFDEQVLLFAQAPEATAVLDTKRWNNRFGRWVKRGSIGIALLDLSTHGVGRLKFVFDISDTTPSKYSPMVPIWEMRPEYHDTAIGWLDDEFGPFPLKSDLRQALSSAAERVVYENFERYYEMLSDVMDNSALGRKPEEKVKELYRTLLQKSITFCVFSRCGIDAKEYFKASDFQGIDSFNTIETINGLGIPTATMTKEILSAIAEPMWSLHRNYLLEQQKQERSAHYGSRENCAHQSGGRSEEGQCDDSNTRGNGSAVCAGERVLAAGNEVPRTEARVSSESLGTGAHEVDGGKPASTQSESGNDRNPSGLLDGHSESGGDADEQHSQSNGGPGRSDGGTETERSDEVDGSDGEYYSESEGNRTSGGDLPLIPSPVEQFADISSVRLKYLSDQTIKDILAATPYLKKSLTEISDYFADVTDDDKRALFIKECFNADYTELLLGADKTRVGYKAEEKGLTLFEGSWLNKSGESFLRWHIVADYFDGLRLLGQLHGKEDNLLTQSGQTSFFPSDTDSGIQTDAIIDKVLRGGSGFVNGKMRIYQQFLAGKTPSENAAFLKDEYGIGGRFPAFSGGEYDVNYDGKGLQIRNSFHPFISLSWPQVEKRIRTMIDTDHYLTEKEKKNYPDFLAEKEQRAARAAISEEFRSIIYDYNSYMKDDTEKQIELYHMSSCWSAYTSGEQTIYCKKREGENVHQLMVSAMEMILAENTPLTERCNAMLELLAEPELQPDKIEVEPQVEQVDTLPSTSTPPAELIDYDSVNDEELFQKAVALINDYYLDEFEDEKGVDLGNLEEIWLGDTTSEDDQHEVGVILNMLQLRLDTLVDGQVFSSVQYHSLSELIDLCLSELDFDSLTSLPDEYLDQFPVSIVENGSVVTYANSAELVEHYSDRTPSIEETVRTPSQRYADNVAAIKLLHDLEQDKRSPSDAEREALTKYVGWGGLPEAFDATNAHYTELKTILDSEEYQAARASTLTAFFTPKFIIQAMYNGLRSLGFEHGTILDPCCGIGKFGEFAPKTADYTGVELDSVSGRIAKQLYPGHIKVQGFETTAFDDGQFDVVIGNVPFGNFKVTDKRYKKNNWLIHDYFFGKSLDLVRPGGIIAFITSTGTMDKVNPAVRKYIAQRAELLGGIRLPNTAFQAAGTTVSSDILFFQRRPENIEVDPDWVHLDVDQSGITMNSYFTKHPEMILGKMQMVSGPFGMMPTCVPKDGDDIQMLLTGAMEQLQTGVFENRTVEITADNWSDELPDELPAAPADLRSYSFFVRNGTLYFKGGDGGTIVSNLKGKRKDRVVSMVKIRDSLRKLIQLESDDFPDDMIASQQAELNQLYDDFVVKYGRLTESKNGKVMSDDVSYPLLASLENVDSKGNFESKATIFTQRTIKPKMQHDHANTAFEALEISLAEKAKVDMPYMCELLGEEENQVYAELTNQVFRNPLWVDGREDGTEKYITADEYLSGNVKEKLNLVKALVENGQTEYQYHVGALEAVQPTPLKPNEISVRIGSAWIPPEIIKDFGCELFKTEWYVQPKIKVLFEPYSANWRVQGKNEQTGIQVSDVYGTSRITAWSILEQTLNLKDVSVYDTQIIGDKSVRVLNKRETALARAKQTLIKQKFADWIWADESRRNRLCKIYNEKYNCIREREFDGSFLELTGINPSIDLRPHQLNAIARILLGGNTLLAHVVGAGKTYTMAAAAMESKRLGLCHKSMVVVPGHITGQWAKEVLTLYPSANILVAYEQDFNTANRKKFCSRIATGDYDMVIIGHTQFEKIPLSPDYRHEMLEQEKESLLQAIEECKRSSGSSWTVKQMEKTRKSIEAEQELLYNESRKDNVVYFDELGIDRLFIDEAHYYKNMNVHTKMNNVRGIPRDRVQKTGDLYLKCRCLDQLTGNRGVIFATGTPVSNTMVEMFAMQKYLQHDTLAAAGLIQFDNWASVFGENVTAAELKPTGTGYRTTTRFARFFNLPELMQLFRRVADIQTADMLKLPVPEVDRETVVLPPSDIQVQLVEELGRRADLVHSNAVNSNEDNMLTITSDGRKLALDQRLFDPELPSSDTSKVAACADRVFEIWTDTSEQKSTQMVFCDLSTPKDNGFSIYTDLKTRLIALGIPPDEIAFIHSAKDDKQKQKIFRKVNAGEIRVLLGSTAKMGAGTNAQQRLIALHHLDCPWKPSDLEQREGRIIRQGNENKRVKIYSYVTKGTFDAYMWQLIEGKQKFVSQIMTGKSPARSVEDVDERSLSYAEIKALASGDGRIKEKMELDIDVSRLKMLKADFLSQKWSLEKKLKHTLPASIQRYEKKVSDIKTDIKTAEALCPDDDNFQMQIGNHTFTKRTSAGAALVEALRSVRQTTATLGSFAGFDIQAVYKVGELRVWLHGVADYEFLLGDSALGNIARLENAIKRMPDTLESSEHALLSARHQLDLAKREIDKPFFAEEELKEKEQRLNQLNIELNLDQHGEEILDEEPQEEERKIKPRANYER